MIMKTNDLSDSIITAACGCLCECIYAFPSLRCGHDAGYTCKRKTKGERGKEKEMRYEYEISDFTSSHSETNKTQKTCKDPGLSGLRGGGGVHCLTVMSLTWILC